MKNQHSKAKWEKGFVLQAAGMRKRGTTKTDSCEKTPEMAPKNLSDDNDQTYRNVGTREVLLCCKIAASDATVC